MIKWNAMFVKLNSRMTCLEKTNCEYIQPFTLYKKMKFPIKNFFSECDQTADQVTFTDEILNGNVHFLCSVNAWCLEKGHTYLRKLANESCWFTYVCLTFLWTPDIKGLKYYQKQHSHTLEEDVNCNSAVLGFNN